MPYVERDEANNLSGLYARPQPGVAEEELPDDNAEVMAFRSPPPAAPEDAPTIPDDAGELLIELGLATRANVDAALAAIKQRRGA